MENRGRGLWGGLEFVQTGSLLEGLFWESVLKKDVKDRGKSDTTFSQFFGQPQI